MRGGGALGVEQTTSRRRPRPDLQHARPQDAQGPAGVHPGLGQAVRGQGREGQRVGEVLQPGCCRRPTSSCRSSTATSATLTRAIVAGASVTGAVAEKRAELAALIGNLNTMRTRSRTRTRRSRRRSACCPTRCARATRRSSTCARRSTTSTRSSSVQAGDEGPARVLPRAAPAARRGDADVQDLSATRPPAGRRQRRRPTSCSKLPRLQQIGSPTFRRAIEAMKKGQPVIDFLRPYSPDLVGWFRDFGRRRGQLRRQRPLRAHPCRSSAPSSSSRTPTAAGAQPGPARRSGSPGSTAAQRAAARAPPASPRPDGSNPFAPAASTATPPTYRPGHEAASPLVKRARGRPPLAVLVVVVSASAPAATAAGLPRARDLRQRRASSSRART